MNAFLDRVVEQIVNPLILLLGAAAFIVFIWGVFVFIKDAGDENKREEGRHAIMWGLIGLVIIFGAYGILNLAAATFNLGEYREGEFQSESGNTLDDLFRQ